jgi:small subunit ribosomal protein S11
LFIKKNKKQTYNNLIKYLKLNAYIKKIDSKVSFLNQINEEKKIKNLNLISKNNFFNKPKNLIKYIISINLLEKNTFVNVTDIKGKLKFFRSAGFVELKGKRKIKQPLALNSLINSLKSDAKFLYNQPIALHLINVNSFSYNYVLSKLEEKFFITYIRAFNLIPHNGCRPRKIKRGKKRSKKLK